MPNIKSNLKYLRKSNKRREKNLSVKSRLKTLMKQIDTSVEKKEPTEKIAIVLNLLYKYLDKAAGKNIIKKNKAARKKSQYSKKVYPFKKQQKQQEQSPSPAS